MESVGAANSKNSSDYNHRSATEIMGWHGTYGFGKMRWYDKDNFPVGELIGYGDVVWNPLEDLNQLELVKQKIKEMKLKELYTKKLWGITRGQLGGLWDLSDMIYATPEQHLQSMLKTMELK